MRLRGWLIVGLVALPAVAAAQTVKAADLIGGWQAKLEHGDSMEESLDEAQAASDDDTRGWLVLWPDGLWWYAGAFKKQKFYEHGGARWRLVGDTLWLGNDYEPYWHSMIDQRMDAIQQKGYGLGVMDMGIINQRSPYPVPDSVYWSKAFRDSTTACAGYTGHLCGTWVYKVSKKDQQLDLVRLDSLSRATTGAATKAVLTRDSLPKCQWWRCD